MTVDRTGLKYGKLTAIKRVDSDDKNSKWLCRCECGNYKAIYSCHLKSGAIKSCGCGPTGRPKLAHGKADQRVYRIWKQMKQRCNNPKAEGYENYGGRGIKVCQEWEVSFPTFYADMGDPPEGTTIDRIDVNKDYGPDNCKWSTWTEQHRNRRDNHNLEAFGKTMCLTAWSEKTKIPVSTLKNRMYRGLRKMTLEEAIKTSAYAQQKMKRK